MSDIRTGLIDSCIENPLFAHSAMKSFSEMSRKQLFTKLFDFHLWVYYQIYTKKSQSETNKPDYKKSLRAYDILNRNLTHKRKSNSPARKLDMLDNVSRLINLALISIKHAITRATYQLKWKYHVTDNRTNLLLTLESGELGQFE